MVEVTHVPGGQQAVDDLFATAAGVALEREGVADEDPADLALRHLLPLSSRIFTFGALTTGPTVAGFFCRSSGRAMLANAISVSSRKVVHDRAQRLQGPGGQLRAELRAGDEHDPQRGQVRLGVHLPSVSSIRDNMTGTTTIAVTLCSGCPRGRWLA